MGYKTIIEDDIDILVAGAGLGGTGAAFEARYWGCLLYTSPSPRDLSTSRMPSSA